MWETQPGQTSLARTLRGFAALVAVSCVTDWAIKLSHPLWFGGWYPHQANRPAFLTVLLVVPVCGLVAVLFARPITTWATGLLAGGTAANMLNLSLTGVVWDMFHLPGSDVVFNFADVLIVAGWTLLLAGSLYTFWEHREHLLNHARNLQQRWASSRLDL